MPQHNPPALTEPAYSVSEAWLLDALDVDPAQGLSTAQAEERLRRFGPNRIGVKPRTPWWRLLLGQFRGAVVWLLIAAAGLAVWMGDTPEAIAITTVLIVNSAIGLTTEMRAADSMEALRNLTHATARVRRDGRDTRVDAEDLAPGDIVLLEAGDVSPADLRLIEAADLRADESTLTGESMPVAKSAAPVPGATPLAERRNMLFRSVSVSRGAGVGVVVATGARTQIGEISELVARAEADVTPLERRLDQLGRQLSLAAIGLSALVGAIGLAAGRPLIDMTETAIALAVAAAPEGLPIVATLALARGMWRMAARNALINRLSAVETLGAASVLMTDKTGTLTENRMTVARLRTADAAHRPGETMADPAIAAALRVMALCNDAALSETEGGDLGDPMEVALLRGVEAFGALSESLRAAYPRARVFPFDPDLKMMATVNVIDGRFVVSVKGAPEAVLARCDSALTAAGPVRMKDAMRASLAGHAGADAAEGKRMLALAQRDADAIGDDPYRQLTFLGLVSLIDPPRKDVADAIAECHAAGMRVIMVTGDHKVTARRIAQDVGLVDGGEPDAHEAAEVSAEADDETRRRLLDCDVFARVSPHDKLTLVAMHQAAGSVVAMTGDGVNDAPALKKADIGVAMGRRGAQVAAEAADVILRDDAFGSIVHAIREGRVIYGNIQLFIRYLFTCNLSEILLLALALAAALPAPLLPLQILYLNLLTDIFPAIALGFGEGDAKVMRRPPRRRSRPLIAAGDWRAIVFQGFLLSVSAMGAFVFSLLTRDEIAATTTAYLTICTAQLVFVFTLRRPGESLLDSQITRNRFIWLAVVFSTGLMLLGVYAPPLQHVLQLSPPSATEWLLIVAAGFAPSIVIAVSGGRVDASNDAAGAPPTASGD